MHNDANDDRRIREQHDEAKRQALAAAYGFDAGPPLREMAEMAVNNPNEDSDKDTQGGGNDNG